MFVRKPVVEVDQLTGKVVARYPSCTNAATRNGLTVERVAAVCRNKRLLPGWTTFRFEGDEDPEEVIANRTNCPVALFRNGVLAAVYPNRRAVATAMYVAESTVTYAVRRGYSMLGFQVRELPMMGALGDAASVERFRKPWVTDDGETASEKAARGRRRGVRDGAEEPIRDDTA